MRRAPSWVMVGFLLTTFCWVGVGCSTPSSVCKEIAEASCKRAEACGSARAQSLSACEEREIKRMDCDIKTEETLCLPGQKFQVDDMERCLEDIGKTPCLGILANDGDGLTRPPASPASCDFCVSAK